MMTKRHFEAIAEVIQNEPDCGDEYTARHIAEALATLFAEMNPRFDRARFLRACGATTESN